MDISAIYKKKLTEIFSLH